jgi:hypothetical protein
VPLNNIDNSFTSNYHKHIPWTASTSNSFIYVFRMRDSGSTVSVGARVYNNAGTSIFQETLVSTGGSGSKPAHNIRVDGLTNDRYVICMAD